MNDFPDFMKNPANRIANANQATPGVEGYVFDGVDGSQRHFGPVEKMPHPQHTPIVAKFWRGQERSMPLEATGASGPNPDKRAL